MHYENEDEPVDASNDEGNHVSSFTNIDGHHTQSKNLTHVVVYEQSSNNVNSWEGGENDLSDIQNHAQSKSEVLEAPTSNHENEGLQKEVSDDFNLESNFQVIKRGIKNACT